MSTETGESEFRCESKALILMYHRVAAVNADPFSLAVAPSRFAEQMEILRREATVIPLRQLVKALAGGSVRKGSVVLTFDDGYSDNLQNAAPLMARHEIPATVFVTTGFVEQDRELWWDELERLFLEPGVLPQTLDLTIGGADYRWELGASACYSQKKCRLHSAWTAGLDPVTPRHSIYISLWRLLRRLPEGERRAVLDRLASWAGVPAAGRTTYRGLSAVEVRSLGRSGLVEIGAHTVMHPFLPELGHEAQRSEIHDSKRRLEGILECPVTSFAYPYGAHSDQSVGLVRDAGFQCACVTMPGLIDECTDVFRLPRVQVENWSGEQFAQKLAAWFDAPPKSAIWSSGGGAFEPALIKGKWLFRNAPGNAARLLFPDGGAEAVRIAIDAAGTQTGYDIQLNRPNLPVNLNGEYEVVFSARADRPRALSVGFAQAHEPWSGLGMYATVELTTEWQSFSISFQANADEENGRIHIDAGGSDISVDLRGLELRPVSKL